MAVRTNTSCIRVLFALHVSCTASIVSADEQGFIETFSTSFDETEWYFADYTHPDSWIDTRWSPDNILLELSTEEDVFGSVTLSLQPNDELGGKSFVGGELQRSGFYGYGDYEVLMRAAEGDGMLSSFFTYTGPPFGTPHDEIDFEILGRDSTRVCLNRYVDGERMDREWVRLGFDAAETPNLYRFEWREDRITWFVNGVQVYEVTSENVSIPTHPSKIMMNIWAGGPGQYDWLRSPDEKLHATAVYHCVSYRPVGEDLPDCSDLSRSYSTEN